MDTKKDSTGFLSKVATLFRGSAADTRPSDVSTQAPSAEEDARMRESLRISKHRDDLVRRREFNYLRKLRQVGQTRRTVTSRGTQRPSVFQSSSTFGMQERATTVQKINAIESSIVQSWGKAKTQPASEQTPVEPPAAAPAVAPMPEEALDFDLDFTSMRVPSAPARPGDAPDAATSPVEPQLGPLERVLLDAALRFAEGYSETAAGALQAIYQDPAVNEEDASLLARTLFDLYRSIGAHAAFDALALNYAQRFGRSPAEWFSLPDLLHKQSAEGLLAGDTASTDQTQAWTCPPTLDATALRALRSRLDGADVPWAIDWSALLHLSADACSPFIDLIALWNQQALRMHWNAEYALLRALAEQTPAGQRSTDPLWWHLRLDVLCLLHMQDAFEELALEYCVLYEESPPSWRDAPCQLLQVPTTEDYASVISTLLPLDTAPRAWLDLSCALCGEVLGETSAGLAPLNAISASASQITVDCALLARIDFDAASSIVNWAHGRAAQGCDIEFTELTHLLAVLLHHVGLDSYAQITVRAR